MANYNQLYRTNYFHIKDEYDFKEFLNHIVAEDMELFTKTDEEGCKIFGFGGSGSILGYFNDTLTLDDYEDYENAFDRFLKGLQTHVENDDAIILMNIGNEKLRYVDSDIIIITSNKIKDFNMHSVALNATKVMLNNMKYETQLDY